MKVSEILLKKGQEVKAVLEDAPLDDLVQSMRRENVGALVVRTPAGGVAGLVSERDIVRSIADHGIRAHGLAARDVMGPANVTCSPDDSVRFVARLMTDHMVRHLTVVWNARLVGVVSIGDVVKHRLDEMELETKVLRDVAAGASTPAA